MSLPPKLHPCTGPAARRAAEDWVWCLMFGLPLKSLHASIPGARTLRHGLMQQYKPLCRCPPRLVLAGAVVLKQPRDQCLLLAALLVRKLVVARVLLLILYCCCRPAQGAARPPSLPTPPPPPPPPRKRQQQQQQQQQQHE